MSGKKAGPTAARGNVVAVERVRIASLRPAPYNPRRIQPEQFEELKRSLATIGCVMPVLVNRADGTIIAGHQRTKAMLAIGMEKCPAFFVERINKGDEMKFNQLHNGTEIRAAKASTCRATGPLETFTRLPAGDFTVGDTCAEAVKEIANLLLIYGNVLSCVVCNGRVFVGHAYVRACALLRYPVNTYIASPSKEADIVRFFGQDYGEYFYGSLEKRTYVQGMAQMYRTKIAGGKGRASILYDRLVLPYLKRLKLGRAPSVLDFGCGRADYIQFVHRTNPLAIGVEFFYSNGVGGTLNVMSGHRQIDNLIRQIGFNGLFDVVVCDSVLNSVDSLEAEQAVLRCLNLFWNGKGAIFVSGRLLEQVKGEVKKRTAIAHKQFLRFLDKDGFTATYRKGNWFYQKYHTRETIEAALAKAGLRAVAWGDDKSAWRCQCVRARELTRDEKLAAIEFEFNLPLPRGRRYNRHGDVIAALDAKGLL